jgi:S-(hydroxymethyl)glutathione dehydrogenase/alcohol dehydrogenase
MKAAILENINTPLSIQDIEIPKLKCGQVLVEIHYSSICGAQIREITGAKGEDKYLPHLLGHEGSGIILDIGEGVTTVKREDHVVMHWRKGNGIESDFPKYKNGDNYIGGGKITTFSETAIVSENRVTAIEKDIPLDIACLFGCSVTTGLGIIKNEAKSQMGDSVAVIGCGGVGLNVIQGASLISAYPIIAIDIKDDKLKKAEEFGATHLINLNDNNNNLAFEKLITCKDLFNNPIKTIIECTGNIENITRAYNLLAAEGKLVLVGQPHHLDNITFNNFSNNFFGKTLMDSQGGKTNPTEDIPRYLRLYKAGKLKLDELISHRYPLIHINEAISKVKEGNAIKCLINMR